MSQLEAKKAAISTAIMSRKSAGMHVVLYMSERDAIPSLDDQTAYLFCDEDAADQFIYDKLVEAGVIEEESELSRDEAILEAQSSFSGLEFFHSYPLARPDQCATASGS